MCISYPDLAFMFVLWNQNVNMAVFIRAFMVFVDQTEVVAVVFSSLSSSVCKELDEG